MTHNSGYSITESESNIATRIPELITGTDTDRREYASFSSYYIGFCPRQIYTIKLGLRDSRDMAGQFQATQVVSSYIEAQLGESERLTVHPEFTISGEGLQLSGRPTAYDSVTNTVWHCKTRDGWYKHHPPVQRHLDQLQVYMEGLNAKRGRILYVSLSDLADYRLWPPESNNSRFLHHDPTRIESLLEKVLTVRDQIITHGIATTKEDIPFEKCGCFLCNTETLQFPSVVAKSQDAHSPPRVEASTGESGKSPDTSSTNEKGSSQSTTSRTDHDDQFDFATTQCASRQRHIPRQLRQTDLWVVWDGREKYPRAPWETGTMYPCEWAADKPGNPRRNFKKAFMIADLSPDVIHKSWPFPEADDLPEQIYPAILLKHNPDDSPVTVLDFDGVREPETGQIPHPVWNLIKDLGGYTEISTSGTGLHVFVRGGLPDEYDSFTGPVPGGRVEIYEASRFIASTWRHVEGTPENEIPEVPSEMTDLVDRLAANTMENKYPN